MSWSSIRDALWVAAALIFAGCGGVQSTAGVPILARGTQDIDAPGTMQQPSAPSESGSSGSTEYKISSSLLFVVNFVTNSSAGNVVIYNPKFNNPSPIAVITKGILQPNGACVDGAGTLYVGSDPASGSGWISEYSLGQTKPVRTITSGINSPGFCAIDARGNLWVTNSGSPNVTEYLKGSVKPHATITKGLSNPNGIAIDGAGNLYVANLVPYGSSNVQVYHAGSRSPSRTITAGLSWPVGIGVDTAGRLFVTNDTAPCNVEEYRAGESHPYREITDGVNGPTDVTFSKSGRLYVVNQGAQNCSGQWPAVLEFRSGSVRPSKKTISTGLHTPVGSAYYPPQLP